MIYLDANATSRLRPEARAAMESVLSSEVLVSNPSSIHEPGRKARSLLSKARFQVSALLGLESAEDTQITFTSGGTEACNSAIFGLTANDVSGHIASSAIEHQSVLEPLKVLERRGWEITLVRADSKGVVSAEEIRQSVRATTRLVILMAANNVTGAVQPVLALSSILREQGYSGSIFCDATQALGKSNFSARKCFDCGVDVLAISAHKVGAPAGVGALVFRDGDPEQSLGYSPLIIGGAQEDKLRAGTENLLGIVGFGAAASALSSCLNTELVRMERLKEKLYALINSGSSSVLRLSYDSNDCLESLNNTLALVIDGVRAEDLVAALDLKGVAVSTGSACSSGKQEVSHVFRAMELSDLQALSAIRLSLDYDATEVLVEKAAGIINEVVTRMRMHTSGS